MHYNKTSWVDRNVQHPRRFTKSGETSGEVTLTPSPGTVTAAGTAINASNLNNIEGGVENANNEKAKLPATLHQGLQQLTVPQSSPVRWSAQGRTQQNILARLGDCETLTGWTTSGTVELSSTWKRSGANSFKLTASADNPHAYVDLTYPLDTAKQYVVRAWVFIESYTSGDIDIRLWDVGGFVNGRYTAAANTATVGSWQFIYVKIPTSNTFVGTGLRVQVRITTGTAVAYFDEIDIQEVDSTTYTAIGSTITATSRPSIDDVLPHVSGMQHVRNPAIEVTSDNLIGFSMWEQGTLGGSGGESSATNAIRTKAGRIRVIPGATYTLKFWGSYGTRVHQYDVKGTFVTNDAGFITTASRTITVSATTEYLRIGFRIDASTPITPSDMLGVQIMLVPGSTAPTVYKAYNFSYAYAHSDLDGNPLLLRGDDITGVYDVLIADEERVIRRWREHVLQEADIGAIGTGGSNTDYVTVTLSTVLPLAKVGGSGIDGFVKIIDPDGAPMHEIATADIDTTAAIHGFNWGSTSLSLVFAKDAYENLAAAKTALAGTKVCYQLAAETSETVHVEGVLNFGAGGNLIRVGQAVEVREIANPKYYGPTDRYAINNTVVDSGNADGSWLTYRTNRIMNVYRSGDLDTKWTIVSDHAAGNGGGQTSIAAADYNPDAEYTVTYEMLDYYAYGAKVAVVEIEYGENVGTVVADNVRDIKEAKTDISAIAPRANGALQRSGGKMTGDVDMDGNMLNALGVLNLLPATELTIASGEITVTQSYHTIDTEGDASTDDLTTINGGSVGDILLLRQVNASRDVTIKNATGNIFTSNGLDIFLGTSASSIWLYKYASNAWAVLGPHLTAAQIVALLASTTLAVAQLNVDNLRVDGNTLSSTNSNGDVIVNPNGTGKLQIKSGAKIDSGSGDPEGAVTAPVGSLFLRSDGGVATSLYVKESGSGNTGWRAVAVGVKLVQRGITSVTGNNDTTVNVTLSTEIGDLSKTFRNTSDSTGPTGSNASQGRPNVRARLTSTTNLELYAEELGVSEMPRLNTTVYVAWEVIEYY